MMGKTADVHEAVRRELDFDPLVDARGITVVNLGGAVALNGVVASYPEYLEAAAAARRVAGVGRLDNHLEVVLSDGAYRDDRHSRSRDRGGSGARWRVRWNDGTRVGTRDRLGEPLGGNEPIRG